MGTLRAASIKPCRVRGHIGITLRRKPGAQVHAAQLLADHAAEVGERDEAAVQGR